MVGTYMRVLSTSIIHLSVRLFFWKKGSLLIAETTNALTEGRLSDLRNVMLDHGYEIVKEEQIDAFTFIEAKKIQLVLLTYKFLYKVAGIIIHIERRVLLKMSSSNSSLFCDPESMKNIFGILINNVYI